MVKVVKYQMLVCFSLFINLRFAKLFHYSGINNCKNIN